MAVEDAGLSVENSAKRKIDQVENNVEEWIPPVEYLQVISDERAMDYVEGRRTKPYDALTSTLKDTLNQRDEIELGSCIIHWFKTDLRTIDNRALSRACQRAKSQNLPLICVYLINIKEWRNHAISKVRVDFILRSLQVLYQDLKKFNITLVVESCSSNTSSIRHLLEFASKHKCNHIYSNMEYEVDELRRDAKLVRKGLKDFGIAVYLEHDTCVVNPDDLFTKTSDKPFSVFAPFYKAWVAHVCQHTSLLDEAPKLEELKVHGGVDSSELKLPDLPADLSISNTEDISELWPAGEGVALSNLEKWLDTKLSNYKDNRDLLDLGDATSNLSVYIASGNLAARTAVRKAVGFKHSTGEIGKLRTIMDMNSSSVANWCSEIAWRDFYRNICVNFPYVCMNKPFKLKTAKIAWSNNKEDYLKWTRGETGFPIVDAAMRQMLKTGYMHNRGRMIAASFLSKHLLINWQWGEYFFMKHLIDCDFASNNGGWGFSSSCGVDAQPYFRIFNPYRQSERFDKNGEYIRTWIPELRDVKGDYIHDPYSNEESARIAAKNGYPKPMVSHSKARQRALETFKLNNSTTK